jgi:SAM-dependent methyltransferase
MTNKLESKSMYPGKDTERYREAQIRRHAPKSGKTRNVKYYQSLSKTLLPYVNPNSNMVCLGTRNNHERDCFRKELNLKEVYSVDISPKSNADYVLDFNFLPTEWENSWDIVFSNSIDHALDPTKIFYNWLDIVRPNGYLFIGFDCGEHALTLADCNSFREDNIRSFLKECGDQCSLVSENKDSYFHCLIRKK